MKNYSGKMAFVVNGEVVQKNIKNIKAANSLQAKMIIVAELKKKKIKCEMVREDGSMVLKGVKIKLKEIQVV